MYMKDKLKLTIYIKCSCFMLLEIFLTKLVRNCSNMGKIYLCVSNGLFIYLYLLNANHCNNYNPIKSLADTFKEENFK